jgi:transposase
MFIKTIIKTDKSTKKVYEYLRLCESYRLGDKTRHHTIVSLGLLPNIDNREKKKALADRIESLIIGNSSLFLDINDPEIEALAQLFYNKILEKKNLAQQDTTPLSPNLNDLKSLLVKNIRNIDLDSIVTEDVREIGAEWLCLQAIEQLSIPSFLKDQGWEKKWINYAIIHLISKSVYPCAENKAEYWIRNNSDVASLLGMESQKITRHHLYEVSRRLYKTKLNIEPYLSHKTNTLFDIQDKIILYDLTNTYFEGRKETSDLAQFGRSKEKRSDAKLISLALVTNAEGFVKYSKIYSGNISEPSTLLQTIEALSTATSSLERSPLIVMDAAFSTDENMTMLKENGFDYLSVTRSKLKHYTVVEPNKPTIGLQDNRGNKINVEFVTKKPAKKPAAAKNDTDTFLHIKSDKKAVKEASMESKFSIKFEAELLNLTAGLSRPRGTKKIEKVAERIGKIKEKYAYANKYYDIEIEQKDGIVNNIIYKKKPIEKKTTDGVYFIRTSKKNLKETDIWNIYNTLTEIESTFRTLKTDLAIRPVHHQKDENTEAHIFLGVLAYQVVSTIRHQLKTKNINDSWQTIVMKMNTQKSVITSMMDVDRKKIVVKTCSQPSSDAKAIYKALNYKNEAFKRKNIVFPEK